jgi:glutamine synthetase
MLFSNTELAVRAEKTRAVIEQLTTAGCRFVQMEIPDNNGVIRGKLVTLKKGLGAVGMALPRLLLCVKGGDKVSFNSPFSNFGNGLLKLTAVPDLSTVVALPWKQDVAAVLCDYYMDDGSRCPLDPRHILRSTEETITKMNYSVQVALECEFYIVIDNDALMREGRFAELQSFGRDHDTLSLTRIPSYEGLAKEFIGRCNAADIRVDTFHTEGGRGMFEYSFEPQSAVKAADDYVRAKLLLKQLCAERGLAATYMAAKFYGTGDSFSGCHHNLSLLRGGKNAFWDESSSELSTVARYAAAGILKTMPAFNLIYRPWPNSYRRMDRHLFNPQNASWGKDNHSVALRVVTGATPDTLTRFEHRAPGADVNPYLAIASILFGCILGIKERHKPPRYVVGDAMLDESSQLLPHTMPDAIEAFRSSPHTIAAFGKEFVDHLSFLKHEEWNDFSEAVAAPLETLKRSPVTSWESQRYFHFA